MPCDDCRAREAEVERWTAHANKYEALALTLDNDKAALKAENERLRVLLGVAEDWMGVEHARECHYPKPPEVGGFICKCGLFDAEKMVKAALAPVDAPPVRVVRSKEWWMEKARAEEGTPAAGMLARDPVDAPAPGGEKEPRK